MRLSSSPFCFGHSVQDDGTRRKGAALVIVLAFVVLLTGLIVAYFARSMTARQLSNSSAGQTKSAVLAQSASDIVIAGLKQEIVNGSSPTPTPPITYPYYVPLAPANAVPVRFGTPAPIPSPLPSSTLEAIPNLVRRSVAGDYVGGPTPAPAPAVPSLASKVNSATDAALNGRSITPQRWNSHYLMPRDATRLDTDSTPAINSATASPYFLSPDWVLMTRGGPEVEKDIITNSINNPVSTNQHYVIGRYAYTIYDEGGLLDMNVAGYPSPSTPAATSGFTQTQVSQKGSVALADLTQLPISATATLAQTSVDSIVGWRNYAAASPKGDYPNFTFSPTQASSWFTNFGSINNNGFLKVYGGPANSTGPTDQALLSRQQLLRLRSSIGFSANALQYMGTFSRSLEQPSFIPAHIQYPNTAPSINSVASTAPPAAAAVDSYLGNNDAAGVSSGVSGQDLINPSLLTIRVGKAFNRFDPSQTLAVIGEPLVKKKFALSRLAEISFLATDSSTSLTDPNFTPNPFNPTARNHIKDWFGLSRTTSSSPWTYSHGMTHIMALSEVAAANREPDFAELLKAAINVGSLAKGGPNLHNNQGNYQFTIDTTVDYQVLQIMANLIDQYDTDSYPTVIQIAAGTLMRQFRGVEDLPYFYRYHPMTVVTRLPSPLLAKTDAINWHNGTPPPLVVPPAVQPAPPASFKTSYDCAPGTTLTDAGQAVFLYVPDVWNPHDANTALTYPTGSNKLRPTLFRMSVITDDPAIPTPQTTAWNTGCLAKVNGDWYDDIPPKASIPAALLPLVDGSTSFTFSDNNGQLYREPTLLYRADAPTNGNLTPDANSLAGSWIDANSKVAYYGVQIGQTPVSYIGVVNTTKYYGSFATPTDNVTQSTPASPTGSYIFQASHLDPNQAVPVGGYAQYTFRLQYQDPNGVGNWITYDEKYPDFHGLSSPNLIVNPADYSTNRYLNIWSTAQMNDASTGYDPRTARFGIGTGTPLNKSSVPVLESQASNYFNNSSAAGYTAFGASKFTVVVSNRPYSDRGNVVSYSNPGMTSDPGKNAQIRWFGGIGWSASNGQNTSPVEYAGLFSQNNPYVNILARDNSTVTQIYYEDADGVARRAMGAYANPNATTNLTPNTGSSLPTANTTTPPSTNLDGLPEATANGYSSGFGVGSPTVQSTSRPFILNRPFRSVAEMAYASRGGPWKQIDFFTPESGDTALLDVFCVNEPPSDAIVAGKVNLNTHQAPVLQSIVASVTRDELNNLASKPTSYSALPPLTNAEAANVAAKLLSITTDTTNAWRGPLINIADMVGHFVNSAAVTTTQNDLYISNETVSAKSYIYAGLSGALDTSVYTAAASQTSKIQRMHESAVRALSDSTQTRVWNLMIDVVAQTGRYGPNSTTLAQFAVDGESRYWVHVAIDRFTGEIIDKQIEIVSE